jgi:hypothetical protein
MVSAPIIDVIRRDAAPVAVDLHDEPVAQAAALGMPFGAEAARHARTRWDENLDTFPTVVVPTATFAAMCGLDQGRTVVAPSGTDTRHITPSPFPDEPVVGLASGAGPGRGIETLIEATRLLRADVPDVRLALWLVATGAASERYLAELRARMANEPWVHLASARYKRIGAALARAAVLCIPHPPAPYFDVAFPVKLADGMAAGRPIVVTPRVETAAVVRTYEAGVVADGDRPDDLAAALLKVLSDGELRARLGANARKAAEERFDWQVIGTEVAAELIARSNTRDRPATPARTLTASCRPGIGTRGARLRDRARSPRPTSRMNAFADWLGRVSPPARRFAGRVRRRLRAMRAAFTTAFPLARLPQPSFEGVPVRVLNAKRREIAAKRVFGPDDLHDLAELIGSADEVVPIREAFARRDDRPPRFLALRHDMDHDVENSVRLAEWEAGHGWRSTYYVLHTDWYWGTPPDGEPSPFLLRALDRISSLGHEIGLHNNAITAGLVAGRDPADILAGALAGLRRHGFDVTGSVAHGDPLCHIGGYINYEMFTECPRPKNGDPRRTISVDDPRTGRHHELALRPVSMAEFGLTHEANWIRYSLSLSDTGGRWSTPFAEMSERFAGEGGFLQLLVHPVWWDLSGEG